MATSLIAIPMANAYRYEEALIRNNSSNCNYNTRYNSSYTLNNNYYNCGYTLNNGSTIKNANGTTTYYYATNTKKDLLDKLNESSDYDTFVNAIERADLENLFEDEGPYTVFAPTDSAFAKMDQNELDDLLDNPSALRTFIRSHIVEGRYTLDSLNRKEQLTTVSGKIIDLSKVSGRIKVEDARVIKAEIKAKNGKLLLCRNPKRDGTSLYRNWFSMCRKTCHVFVGQRTVGG